MTTLKLSDLAGPDAAGWSDVAVFVRADGSESEPFVVGNKLDWNRVNIHFVGHVITRGGNLIVRRLGRGRLEPARIVMEGEATTTDDRYEAVCGVLGLHPETELGDVMEAIQSVRSEARNYPALQLKTEGLAAQVAILRAVCRKANVLLTSFAVARNFSEHQKDAAVEVLVEVVAALAATAPTEGAK